MKQRDEPTLMMPRYGVGSACSLKKGESDGAAQVKVGSSAWTTDMSLLTSTSMPQFVLRK
jgi:hypothetical protein